MRNAQQIFDTVVSHLRTQKQLSWNEEGQFCAYRSPSGLKCAIGILIPDEAYRSQMEGQGLRNLLVQKILPIALEQEFRQHQTLLQRLQDTHDGTLQYCWEKAFKHIALDFNLQYTPPNQT